MHVGCSGWQYDDWRGVLYPPGLPQRRWLERYAEVFDTVEVNSTFYRLASRDAVARWVQQTPPGFVFAAKASRYLIHMKKLRDLDQGIVRFYERIEPLLDAGRLGPVLWQLPGWFARDDDRLAEALDALPPGRHAWEFRHESWFCEEVYALLRAHGCALAYGDDARRPLPAQVPTAEWGFVRFHYGTRGRGGNYSERELTEWAARLREWRADRELWIYFNNDWNAYAIRNALRLRELLDEG
ncbi:MAG: hypothetical protein QOK31_534 [Solirubrobacteraceae bacterium]|nr:hypothetical protein [Solirubrobacteraceae bacterium]